MNIHGVSLLYDLLAFFLSNSDTECDFQVYEIRALLVLSAGGYWDVRSYAPGPPSPAAWGNTIRNYTKRNDMGGPEATCHEI